MCTREGKRERGSAVLEFALGWSVLWLIFGGLYGFGYIFYAYNVLQTAVANAAELGSKMDYDIGDTSSPTRFQQALQNMVVYGDETAGNSPILPGLTTANVNVSVTLDAGSMPRDITITITNYSINAIFRSFTPNNKPRATTKYFGEITCSTC